MQEIAVMSCINNFQPVVKRRSYVEKQLTLIESEAENLNKRIRKAERDYKNST